MSGCADAALRRRSDRLALSYAWHRPQRGDRGLAEPAAVGHTRPCHNRAHVATRQGTTLPSGEIKPRFPDITLSISDDIRHSANRKITH